MDESRRPIPEIATAADAHGAGSEASTPGGLSELETLVHWSGVVLKNAREHYQGLPDPAKGARGIAFGIAEVLYRTIQLIGGDQGVPEDQRVVYLGLAADLAEAAIYQTVIDLNLARGRQASQELLRSLPREKFVHA